MSITLDLPQELESELATEATQMGLSLAEYVLRLLSTKSVHTRLAQSGTPRGQSAWDMCDLSVPMSCGPI
jgi:hypothetical protein